MGTAVTHILILTESPFSKRDYDRFGVEVLSQNFRVSILDCTAWLNPDFWDKYSAIVYRCPGYVSVTDLKSLVGHINSQTKAVAIDYLGGCARSKRVRIELKKRNIPRVVVYSGLLPARTMSKKTDIIRSIISTYKPLSALKIIYRRIEQILRRSPDLLSEIVLLSGYDSLKDQRLHSVTHKIWAHSFDFDIYLESNRQVPALGAPYIVFLDENMIYHSDYDYFGTKPPSTELSYYTSMKRFFQALERKTGLPVVVAAHPRSRYDLSPQLWDSYKMIKEKTAHLVQNATLVLCHASTSVSFAVLWRKPIIFLTSNDLMRRIQGPNNTMFSSLLGAPLINIDEKNSQLPEPEVLFSINETAYENYREQYIKRPGTPEQPIWQVFTEYIHRELR